MLSYFQRPSWHSVGHVVNMSPATFTSKDIVIGTQLRLDQAESPGELFMFLQFCFYNSVFIILVSGCVIFASFCRHIQLQCTGASLPTLFNTYYKHVVGNDKKTQEKRKATERQCLLFSGHKYGKYKAYKVSFYGKNCPLGVSHLCLLKILSPQIVTRS